MASVRSSLMKSHSSQNVVMHTIRHLDSNFSEEFFHLVRIIFLIFQQRFFIQRFLMSFNFFYKNAF